MRVVGMIGKCAAAMALMLALFCAVMTAAYTIPDEMIEWHFEFSDLVLDKEIKWDSQANRFGFYMEPGMQDHRTDTTMMETIMAGQYGDSAFTRAMYANGYMRYWHGYAAILRPLLVVYQLHQIRYLNVFVIALLVWGVMYGITKRLGTLESVGFLIALVCGGILVVPISLQYMAAFVVTFCACLLVLWRYPFHSADRFVLFYLIVGMVVNFLDFLTVPLLTLALPLLLCMAIDLREGRGSLIKGIRDGFAAACAWGAGYALCWVSKWAIAAVALKADVMGQVTEHAQLWTAMQAEESGMAGRLDAIVRNIAYFFTYQGIRSMLFPVAFALLLTALYLLARRPLRACGEAAGMLAVTLSPYVWYAVLCHHSYFHGWYVYRLQIVTLFGAYLLLLSMTDRARLRAVLGRRKGGRPT